MITKILLSLTIMGSLMSTPVFAENYHRNEENHHYHHDYQGEDVLGTIIVGGTLCALFCGQIVAPPPPTYYAPPAYVVAPPQVYYAPPPVYYNAPPMRYPRYNPYQW